MSKVWEKSYIEVGTELIVPKSILIEPSKAVERWVATRYIGETEAGILIDLEFKKSLGAHNPCHYKRFIDWASIWCGQIKISFKDGTMLRAVRKKDNSVNEFVKETK